MTRSPRTPDPALRPSEDGFAALPPGSDFVGPSGHAVQFYEREDFLRSAVADHLFEALSTGRSAVMISTAPRREAVSRALRDRGVDVLGGPRNGSEAVGSAVPAKAVGRSDQGGNSERPGRASLLLLDARQALASFMDDGLPDPARFRSGIGARIEAAVRSGDGRGVRVYGDMVELLWRDGMEEAVLRLEELWEEFLEGRPVSLLCAYGLEGFRDEEHAVRFQEICAHHARVLPAESYTRLADDSARERQVGLLQQRARALQTEVRRRRELEAALRTALEAETRARSEAERASRLKDEFLAVLSHELRTPLSAIVGWSQVIDELRSDRETLRQALEAIRRNVRVQVAMIDDLLDASRIATGTMPMRAVPVELEDLILEAVDAAREAAAAKGIDLRARLDPSVPPLAGDPGRLRQVIGNLLSNAVKFSSADGRIDVELKREDAEARITVRDTGQGIAPEFLPHVFDRFRQADQGPTRRHGGLGLGLSVARYLVEAHGGTVTAYSPGEGQGATFTVRLPLSREPRSATP